MATDGMRRQLVDLIPRLRRFARVLAGNMADADDVVQATLEKAMRNRDQWQDDSRLDRWVFAIARNVWIDNRRLAANRNRHDDISEMVDMPGEDGTILVEQRSMQQAVRVAIAQLPEEQRALVGIVILEGYSYRDAAEMLDVPIGTVMSRLSRAKSTLAEALGGMEMLP